MEEASTASDFEGFGGDEVKSLLLHFCVFSVYWITWRSGRVTDEQKCWLGSKPKLVDC